MDYSEKRSGGNGTKQSQPVRKTPFFRQERVKYEPHSTFTHLVQTLREGHLYAITARREQENKDRV